MDKHSFPNGKRLVRDTLKPDDNLHYEKFSDGTVKCIEDEIPFDVPNNWEWCRLQTICAKEIKRGKAPKYEEKSSVIVFAQKCNTKSGFIDISKAKFLAQNTLKKYADEDFLYYNDIIINSTGTGTLGRVGIYKKEDDIYNIKIVPDSHITTVRTIPSEINAQYIYYFLKFNQLYFENSGVGSTNQKELKPEVISTFLIAIPPLNEQNAIIDKVNMVNKHLSNLDNEKEQLKKLISSTKSKILDLSIRGKLVPQDPNDEPASVLLERIRAEKEELIKQGKIKRDKKESVIFKGDDNSYYEKIGNDITCIDDEIPFDIPDTWSWTRISTIADITMGSSPKSQDICNDNQYIEFHQGKIYFSKKTLIKSNQYTRKTTKLAPKQSVLLCVRAPVGELNITDRDICIGRGLASIKSLGNINEEFIFYWLHPYKTYLINQSTGSTFSAIRSDTVRNILIPLPPLMEQKEILNKIQKVFTLLEDLETVN